MTKGICCMCDTQKQQEVVRIGDFVICLKHNSKLEKRIKEKEAGKKTTKKTSKKASKKPTKKIAKKSTPRVHKETPEEKKARKKISKKIRKGIKKKANTSVIYVVGDVNEVNKLAKSSRRRADKMSKRVDNSQARIDSLKDKISKYEDKIIKQKEKQLVHLAKCTDAQFLENQIVKKLKIDALGKSEDGALRFKKGDKWFVLPPFYTGDDKELSKDQKVELQEISGIIKESKLTRRMIRKMDNK